MKKQIILATLTLFLALTVCSAVAAVENMDNSATSVIQEQSMETPSVVTITNPSEGATVSGVVPIVATTNDIMVNSVVFSTSNGQSSVDGYATDGWSFNWDTAGRNGLYTVTAAAFTNPDGTGPLLGSDTINLNVDNSNPTVNITSPANSVSVNGLVSVSVTATDNISVSYVVFNISNGQTITDFDVANGWSFNWDTTGLNGPYTITATAYDAVENTGTDSIKVNVNNSNPNVISIINPADRADVEGIVPIIASTQSDMEANSVVFCSSDGQSSLDGYAADGWGFNWDTATLNGPYTITATAYTNPDGTGPSLGSDTITLNVKNPILGDTYVYGGWLINPNEDLNFVDGTTINGNDSNAFTTITDGIANTNPDKTVFVAHGTYYENNIVLYQNINIIGENNANTIIDGNSVSGSIITVNLGVTVNLYNLTFQNGFGLNGSAIYSHGTLNVTDCNFTNNDVYYGSGGAIYNEGSLTVTNSNFTNNTANHGDGGAIFNASDLTLTGSSFTGNMADVCGGAICNMLLSLKITSCNFTDNIALRNGGAIYNSDSLDLKYSNFNNNLGNGSAIFGGFLNAQFNRFFGNTGYVIISYGSAILNWWGSNADPSSLVSIDVDVDPWIILNVTASPSSIDISGRSTITADLLHNSTYDPANPEDSYHNPADGHVPDGILVKFTDPSWGSITDIVPSSSETLNGEVITTYQADGISPVPTTPVRIYANADNETTYTDINIENPNSPPVLDPIEDKSVDENQKLEFKINATDPDEDALTYSANNLPLGATFDPVTRTFIWIPTYEQAGNYPGVTFSVTDGTYQDTESITITVKNGNLAPIADAGEDIYILNSEMGFLDGSNSYDLDGNLPLAYQWTVIETPINGWAVLGNPNGESGTFTTYGFEGIMPNIFKFQLIVTDNLGMASQPDVINIIVLYDKPIANGGGPYVVDEGSDITLDGSKSFHPAAPIHNIEQYHWKIPGSDEIFAEGVNPTVQFANSGTIELIVTDDAGNKSTSLTQLTVNNVAPQVEAGSDQTVNVGDVVNFAGTFSDPGWPDKHSAIWNFGDMTTATGYVVEEHQKPDSTGTITATHPYDRPGTYLVTLSVTDADRTTTDTLTITVNNMNRPPMLDEIGPKTVNENETLQFTVTGNDPDGDYLTYTASNLPSGATFENGVFSWTPDYTQSCVYTITFTVSDGNLTDSEDVSITVNNVNRPPSTSISDSYFVNLPITMRVAGIPGNKITLEIVQEGLVITSASLIKETGFFKDQEINLSTKIDLSKPFSGRLLFEAGPSGWGANPVWLIIDGKKTLITTFISLPYLSFTNKQTRNLQLKELFTLVGKEITFNATANDPDIDNITFTWTFGDNPTPKIQTHSSDGVNTITDTTTHTYTTKGTYTINLKVRDNEGAEVTKTKTIKIW